MFESLSLSPSPAPLACDNSGKNPSEFGVEDSINEGIETGVDPSQPGERGEQSWVMFAAANLFC